MTSFEKWSAGRSRVTAQKETALKGVRVTPRTRKHVSVGSGGASTPVSADDGGMVPSRAENAGLLNPSMNTGAEIPNRPPRVLSVDFSPYRTQPAKWP